MASKERFLEFLIVGLGLGLVEDLIAVKATTRATIDLKTILIIAIVALPFAAFSELVVDKGNFMKKKEKD